MKIIFLSFTAAVLSGSMYLFGSTSAHPSVLPDGFAIGKDDYVSGGANTKVVWTCGDNLTDSAGGFHYIQSISVSGDVNFPRLCFNQFARQMTPLDSRDTLTEIVPGYYAISSPRLMSGVDSVVIELDTRGRLVNCCYAPDGFHRVNIDGTVDSVVYERKAITRPGQWKYGNKDNMPYGEGVYDFNSSLLTDWTPGVYDIVPSYKSVNIMPGYSTIQTLEFVDSPENMSEEAYHISVRNDSLVITCKPHRQWAAYLPFQTKVMGGRDRGVRLPNVEIDNAPDLPWRGLMIDIARNYQSPRTMQMILRLMAVNHLNKLHFHIADDEAWRLEIPGLPELTDVGARRGYIKGVNTPYLPQIFAGNGDPESKSGTANGYFTREDFISLIKTAYILGIDVIPEIESPGHARAAIRAMEYRAHKRGDNTYRLIHDGDTSRYTSAQSFHDNVMNPALPGPYKFMEKVIDEIIAMYKDAGVPLVGIHIGGDEVPRGAWNGSEYARVFMQEKNLTTQTELHAYFVERLSEMLSKKGVKMHGWQEVALGHSADFNKKVLPTIGGINCWSTLVSHNGESVTDRCVKSGYPTILSNVNHLYFDLAYSPHPEEKGLAWGGYVDEFSAFDAYKSKLCPVSDSIDGVMGLNAHVFAETLRSPQQLYTYLLPKIFGLAERAWNTDTTYTKAQFNKVIGDKELPFFASEAVSIPVHMRQPGIKIIDGKVHMNSPYGIIGENGGVVRYTTDGSDPNEDSPVYDGPFELIPGVSLIKARLYRNKAVSVPTYCCPLK